MADNPPPDWPRNYFNYFTEVEEHFQRARGTGLFLLSPLDWALIESWKNEGVPLEAVLRGIDAAFAKWRAKKTKTRQVNSLAFCAQAVLEEAERMAAAATGQPESPPREAEPLFPVEQLRAYIEGHARAVAASGFEAIAESLDRLAASVEEYAASLEPLEQHLTALEEKLIAGLRARQSDEAVLAARRELDSYLRPYRGKMTASQLAMLERQFLDRRVLEENALPRLSLFYMPQ